MGIMAVYVSGMSCHHFGFALHSQGTRSVIQTGITFLKKRVG